MGGSVAPLLETRRLTKHFGGIAALHELDIHVNQGEILGLIGPNGSGKTTLFNVVTGFYRPTRGSIIFRGQDISGKKPHEIAQMGIGRSFQLFNFFSGYSVLANLVMASYLEVKTGIWESIVNSRETRRKEKAVEERTIEILKFIGLHEARDQLVENLPHGYRKLLQLSIVLATNPELLLLDEPVSGMNLEEIAAMCDIIRKIRELKKTIILVEHNMEVFMALCDRIVVLNFGQKIAEGLPEEVRTNKDAVAAYLGSDEYAT
jgi:branched-chain amino acid transport system ATP-binding protein